MSSLSWARHDQITNTSDIDYMYYLMPTNIQMRSLSTHVEHFNRCKKKLPEGKFVVVDMK